MPKLPESPPAKKKKKDDPEAPIKLPSAKAAAPKDGTWVYDSLEDDEDRVTIMYYGEPGTAKTTSLAMLAKVGKVVYVEAESGLKKGPLTRRGVPIQNLKIVRDGDKDQITYDKLIALCEKLRDQLNKDPNSIAGVIFDSLTEIQKKLLRLTIRKQYEKAQSKGVNRGPHEIYKEDWGTNTEEMRDIIRSFRDLPCHVGFAGLETREEDDDGAIVYRPMLTPKLGMDLMGWVDIVCHTQVKKINGTRYFLGNFQGGKFPSKDRFGILPEIVVNPTYDRIIGYITGELQEDEDEIQQAWRTAKETKSK